MLYQWPWLSLFRSARDILQATTLEEIEKKAAGYQKSFKETLKVEKHKIEDIEDIPLQHGDFGTRAKHYGYRLHDLPKVSNKLPNIVESSMLDSASFDQLSSEHQLWMTHVISDLSEEPVVIAFTQVMPDDEVYAALLSGDKAELSWRACRPWRGITQIVVVLRSNEDIDMAAAKPSAPTVVTLPVSLNLDATWRSSTGSNTHTTPLQVSVVVDSGRATEV